ncbi:MAG TPA: TetR/AcrR family transcriptional regulator [Steroidobacteraceae bacterium]|jgi:AcrR family transcriptional regulator|nr:TetR/AcrR family transcriptional regulator [Steroidobacteraceae bacterium]
MPKTLSAADVEDFRSRLCDVAERLFAAHGPDGVTMREMADALAVSSMTPYRYFKDKDAILAAVRTRAFNRFAAAMERARASPGPRSGNAYLDFALANPASYRLMFDVSQPTFANYPDLVKAMDRARRTMADGLRDLAAAGRFKGDVELAGYVYWSTMHGAVMLELAGLLDGSKLDARKIAKPAVESLGKYFGIN